MKPLGIELDERLRPKRRSIWATIADVAMGLLALAAMLIVAWWVLWAAWTGGCVPGVIP